MLSPITSEVYGRAVGDWFSFRLMIKGDVESFAKTDDIGLKLSTDTGMQAAESEVVSRRAGKLLILNVRVPSNALGNTDLSHAPASIQLGKTSVSFFLNQR